jgi:hypothetical protein
MANEFKIKNGLIVSGSTEIEQNLTVHGTLTAQIHITGTTGYSTFSGSISSSIGSLSSSIASTDYAQNVRLDNLESQSGSIRTDFNSFTSSYTTVSSSLDSRLDSLETESGSIRSDFNGFTSSYTTVSSSLDSRLDVLEAYSGSQQVPTASYSLRTTRTDVYCKNMSGVQIDKGTVVRITGAVGDNPLIGVASLLTEGQSANTLGIAAENIPNDSFGLVITEGVLYGVNTSGMTAGQLIFLGANGTFTTSYPVAPNHGVRLGEVLRVQQNQGSIYVRVDNGSELGEAHDVYDTTTNSSYGDLLVKSGSVWINSKKLNGDYEVTGSLTITQNLNVLGSSSLVYVTSSQLAVSSSTISVNVFEPAERFGGLKVYDSGSSNATASLLWDSLNNHWIYQNASGSNYSGGMLLSGPRNTGSLGDEIGLTSGKIVKSVGGDHLDNSIISETGTTITVSGDLVANSITGAFDFFGLVNRPTLVSGSSQIIYSGLTGIPSGIISSSAQVISSLPEGTVSGSSQVLAGTTIHSGSFFNGISVVSGSAQVDVMSTTNIARLATTGSNVFTGALTGTSATFSGVITTNSGIIGNNSNNLYLSSNSVNGEISFWGNQLNTRLVTILGNGNLGINTVPEYPLDTKTTNASTTAIVGSFHNLDYTTGTKTFIRVRTQLNSNSSYSSYFGLGQDGTLNIVANDFSRGGDLKINPNTGDVTTYRDLSLRTSSLSNNAGTTNLTMYGSEATSNKLSMVQVWNSNLYPVNLISMPSSIGGSASNGFLLQTSYWNGSSVSTSNRFYIDGYNGRVSIGTTSANGQLDVRGSHVGGYGILNLVSTDPCLISLDSTSTYDVRLRYKYNSTDKWFVGMYDSDNYEVKTSNETVKIQVTQSSTINFGASLLPLTNGTLNLGSSSYRWGTVYTSDLSMSNGIGDYTIVEGEEKLYLYNNKNNKVYSFVLQEEDPLTATPKKS